jgi:hypothetical protein
MACAVLLCFGSSALTWKLSGSTLWVPAARYGTLLWCTHVKQKLLKSRYLSAALPCSACPPPPPPPQLLVQPPLAMRWCIPQHLPPHPHLPPPPLPPPTQHPHPLLRWRTPRGWQRTWPATASAPFPQPVLCLRLWRRQATSAALAWDRHWHVSKINSGSLNNVCTCLGQPEDVTKWCSCAAAVLRHVGSQLGTFYYHRIK